MKKTIFSILLIMAVHALVFISAPGDLSVEAQILLSQTRAAGAKCQPTPADYLGPFYKAGAPERTSVGKGYELKGIVKSAADCKPIGNARIEFWLTSPQGEYDDDHRATLYSDSAGNYRFESNLPPGYSGRPPHIHIKISADGFKTLATQHYPDAGSKKAMFDIVLVPVK